MHRHQVRRVQKKTAKAQRNFRNPYGSMYHCCRSGTSAALEYEYLVDRKNNVRELVVRCWFFMLILTVLTNHIANEYYLPFICHDHITKKEVECSDRDHPLTGFSPAGQILLLSSHGKLDFDSDGSLAGYSAPFLRSQGTATVSDAAKGKLPGISPLNHGFKDADRRRAVSDFVAQLAATYGANETDNGTNAWTITHVGEANGGMNFYDNPITVLGYAKAGSNMSMAYGYERIMMVKNMLMYVILPVMTVFLFFSRQEYNIVPRQEWMESQKSSVARDPGKPPPGKYTKQDHKFISLQVSLAVLLLLALTISMSIQAASGGSTIHGYLLVYTVWAVNLFSDVPNFYAFLVTILGTLCYFVFILIDIEHNPIGGNQMLTFFIEKYLPVVFVASIAGHKLDTKHRSHFMGQLSTRKTKRDADIEKRKNFNLVPLPPAIRDMMRQAADEGMEDTQIVIDAYGSVLFADIVSFTVFSTGLDPLHLVRVLNEMFSMHDNLAVRLGIDKIKTLGDCYVASTGMLAPTGNHASLLVKFGIGMHDVMNRLNTIFDLHGKGPKGKDLRIRVGVASGPVVGGVVGGKKFLFDIWGDTVEQSELMESEGVPERVHMSESTYLRAKKDQDLRFEKDDKTRHEGGNGIKDYDKEFSYLAVMPSNIPLWLDELFPPVSVSEHLDDGMEGPHRNSLASSVQSMRHNRSDSYGERKGATPQKMIGAELGSSTDPTAIPEEKGNDILSSSKKSPKKRLARGQSTRPGSKRSNRASVSKKSMAFGPRTKKRRSTASFAGGRNSVFASNTRSQEIKFEGVPNAEMKRQARDLAAKKARERRTYRASFYSPAPPKQPTVKEGAQRLEEIGMMNNPMQKRQNL
jgi:class 3 adenylate cyclase